MKNFLVLSLFLLGLYLPSSFNYVIDDSLTGIYGAIFCFIMVAWKLIDRVFPTKLLLMVLLVNIAIVFSTLISPLHQYTYGAYLPFIMFSLLFISNFKEQRLGRKSMQLLTIVNFANLLLGILVVFNVQLAEDFLMKNYAAYYGDLLPNMMRENNPVLSFGAHSRAAFHYFLFFFMCFVGYKHTGKRIYFMFSLGYIFLTYNLSSNTSYMYLAVMTLIILSHLIRNKFRSLVFVGYIVTLVALFNTGKLINIWNKFYYEAYITLSSDRNGLLGRFSEGGQLEKNFTFMKEHYGRPVGIGYTDSLFFGDSAIFLLILRGTIVLLVLVYLAYFMFLRRNIKLNYQVYLIFTASVLMDVGSSTLLYFRTLYMIPFIIIFLNTVSVDRTKVAIKNKLKGS